MKKTSVNTSDLLAFYEVLSGEEQGAILQLVKAMAEAACKRETGYSIEEYNKALELAEEEPTYKQADVMNEMTKWLSNKKKAAIA